MMTTEGMSVRRTRGFPASTSTGLSILRPQLNVEELNLPMEVTPLNFQVVRRFRDVPIVLAELIGNVLTFKGISGFSHRVEDLP